MFACLYLTHCLLPSCCCSSVVERVLGKDEVMGSSPISSFISIVKPDRLFYFSLASSLISCFASVSQIVSYSVGPYRKGGNENKKSPLIFWEDI